jgi:hypothetical protein
VWEEEKFLLVLAGNMKERDHLEDLDINERIICKWNSKEGRRMD